MAAKKQVGKKGVRKALVGMLKDHKDLFREVLMEAIEGYFVARAIRQAGESPNAADAKTEDASHAQETKAKQAPPSGSRKRKPAAAAKGSKVRKSKPKRKKRPQSAAE